VGAASSQASSALGTRPSIALPPVGAPGSRLPLERFRWRGDYRVITKQDVRVIPLGPVSRMRITRHEVAANVSLQPASGYAALQARLQALRDRRAVSAIAAGQRA